MPLPAALALPGGGSLPSVGLGTFKAQGADVGAAVRWALQQGYRHIDTAGIYRNEAEIGAALAASGVPRHHIFLTSKVSPYQQGSARAAQACEDSLRQLGTPYLDLMLIHWPGAAKQEAGSPANAALRRETWRVLEAGVREGRLRAIGVSNYEVRHLQELLTYGEIPPAVNQVECHPRFQQPALRQFCREHNIAVVAYASLGCGELLADPTVQRVAARSGVSPAQALLLWGLQRGCGVIPKSVREARIAQASPGALLGAAGGEGLSGAALAELDGLEAALGSQKFCWDPAGIA